MKALYGFVIENRTLGIFGFGTIKQVGWRSHSLAGGCCWFPFA